MTYPTFTGKHAHDALFNPKDYLRYKKLDKRQVPKKVIFLYQSGVIAYFLRKYRGQYMKMDFFKGRAVYVKDGVGVIYLHGVGAPYASVFMEELIAAGTKYVISMGTAGGLQREGIFLCEKAIRDEGTSRHYVKPSKYAFASKELLGDLERQLARKGKACAKGVSWTIDAPYRETKKEVARYKKEGVATVEMEAAALYAIGTYRKVHVAAAFVVSDVLGEEKWHPQFHHINLKKDLNILLDAAIETLRNE